MNTRSRFPFFPKMIATSFGAGFWPYGPGTAGAVVGLVLWLPLVFTGSMTVTMLATLTLIAIFTILGVWSADVAEEFWGPDPSKVVMDETVGQWISMLPLSFFASLPHPLASGSFWIWAIISLILFRFFDIVKPLGIRRMESLQGGIGVMADDILAGMYSALLLAPGIYFFN